MQKDSVAARLLPLLEPLQSQIRQWHCRIVPSAMDAADDALRALPLPATWQWKSLQQHLQSFDVETLILQVPLFWQVEPLVHAAARAAGAPLCIVEPGNYPLDRAAARFASANAVVIEAADAMAAVEYFASNGADIPPHWILVHSVDAPSWDTPQSLKRRGLRVVEEIHLAPGLPLLTRCDHITAARSSLLHRSDVFAWSADPSRPTISIQDQAFLFSFANFPLPFSLEGKGMCACGKTLFARG